jgi:hypothetical protein
MVLPFALRLAIIATLIARPVAGLEVQLQRVLQNARVELRI